MAAWLVVIESRLHTAPLISVVAHLIVDVGTRIIPTKVFAGISHAALFIKNHTNSLTLLDFCECQHLFGLPVVKGSIDVVVVCVLWTDLSNG